MSSCEAAPRAQVHRAQRCGEHLHTQRAPAA